MIPAQQYRFVYVQNCWMRAARPSRTVRSVYDYRHSISFSPYSQACLFYGGNSGDIDFIAKHKPDNSCTQLVTLNSEKGLLSAISCFMKRTLTRNKEGRNQDKTLRFCK